MKQILLDKIAKKEIVVGVIGLGYVGLPLAVEKAKAGFQTIGVYESSEPDQETVRRYSDWYVNNFKELLRMDLSVPAYVQNNSLKG